MRALLATILLSTSLVVSAQGTASGRARATRALLTATWERDRKAVLKALSGGAELNRAGPAYARDGNLCRRRTTALILASEGDDLGLAHLLIARGARLDLQDDEGNTALHQAAMDGEAAMARLLLEHGANWRLKNRYGNTPLMLAEIGDGVGGETSYAAITRLIRRRMARERPPRHVRGGKTTHV